MIQGIYLKHEQGYNFLPYTSIKSVILWDDGKVVLVDIDGNRAPLDGVNAEEVLNHLPSLPDASVERC